MADFARSIDGIPVVGSATERDSLFPVATRAVDQRIYNKALKIQQRWDGSAWLTEMSGNAVLLNVKDYGAVGDLSAEDTAAIQSAIDAAEALSIGAVVYFPAGKYDVRDTLTIEDHRIRLVGDGRYATQVYFNPPSAKALFKYQNAGGAVQYQSGIEGMALVGSGLFQKIGVDAWDVSEFHCRDIVTSGWTTSERYVTAGAAITSGTATLVVTGGAFTSADVGKTVVVGRAGASGAALTTTISGFTNSTTVTLAANAGSTVSGAFCAIGADTANPSIGIRTNGREFFKAELLEMYADRPVHIRVNPNSFISADHFRFEDCYFGILLPSEDGYRIDSAAWWSDLKIEGYQSCVLGKNGVHFVSAGAAGSAERAKMLRITNMRREQSGDRTGYAVNMATMGSQVAQMVIDQVAADPEQNGFSIGQTLFGRILNCYHAAGAGRTILSVAGCDDFGYDNCYFAETGTISVNANMVEVFSLAPDPTTAFPTHRFWTRATTDYKYISVFGQKMYALSGELADAATQALPISGAWITATVVVSFADSAAGANVKGGAGTFVLKAIDYTTATPPSTSCGVEVAGASADCVAANHTQVAIAAGKFAVDWTGLRTFRLYNNTGRTVKYTARIYFN